MAKQLWTPRAAHHREERAQGWLACPGGLGVDKASREVRGPLPCDTGTGVGAARHGAGGIISTDLGQVTNRFILSFMELVTVHAS